MGQQVKTYHQKMIASMLTRDAGLPSPEHQLVGSREEALKAAKELGWPLVVKPADQDRGEGVSTDIVDETLLLQAFLTAQKASKSKKAIIERQVEGVCCRIFVSNGKMFYGVKRLPKSVRGNGKDTVRQLIETANAREKMMPPWKRSEPFPSDNETNEALHIAGLSFESVPQQGELVFLRKIESTQWGGTDEDITQTIHPDNLDLALRAAALFDLQVAGIDIITPDITVPWYQNGAIINEVNYSPQYGGGAISRASIPYFLDDLIEEDGRIPVHVFIGGDDAMKQAMELQAEQTQKGLNTVVTDHEKSFFSQQKIYLDAKGLFKRTRALLMDRRVDSLIMVIQNDEFLYTGLPIDHLDDLQIVSQTLHSYTDPKQSLTNDRADQIRTLLATVRS
jgi:cyanophycin synthetase